MMVNKEILIAIDHEIEFPNQIMTSGSLHLFHSMRVQNVVPINDNAKRGFTLFIYESQSDKTIHVICTINLIALSVFLVHRK